MPFLNKLEKVKQGRVYFFNIFIIWNINFKKKTWPSYPDLK